MILVTVGTHREGFNRLVEATDQLAATLDERMVIQRGTSSYEPRHAESFAMTSGAEMTRLTEEARVIVMHAAAGSALVALRMGKPLVMVPRLHRFGEHMDDHQTQLAHGLQQTGQAVAVDDPTPTTLAAAIEAAARLDIAVAGPDQLIMNLRERLQTWNKPRGQVRSWRRNT